MPSRWARTTLSTLAVAVGLLLSTGAAGATSTAIPDAAGSAAPLTLVSQTTFVSPASPWFTLDLGVGASEGPTSDLRVNLTFYGRLDAASQFQQALSSGPESGVIGRVDDIPVESATAAACVNVVPDSDIAPTTSGTGACPAGSPTLTLGCTPGMGTCGDVYPVSVSLVRNGSTSTLSHITTFLTYQEPGAIGEGGPLQVGVVVPVAGKGLAQMAGTLSDHHDVATTLAVDPAAVNQVQLSRQKTALHALGQLAALDDDEVLEEPYVGVDVAALAGAGLTGEIPQQVQRGNDLLRQAGLKPTSGPWVDTVSNFSQDDAGDLGTGVQAAGATALVLSDNDLASGGIGSYTFAQPFTLELGHGVNMPAVAADSSLGARFTANPNDPVLGAEQLLAGLSFVHFENAFLQYPRGVVVEPPPGWQPSTAFMDTLLSGLTGNPALKPVTLSELFTAVPSGANHEPAARHLQAGPSGGSISRTSALKISLDRQQLTSYEEAVSGHPPELLARWPTVCSERSRRASPTRVGRSP